MAEPVQVSPELLESMAAMLSQALRASLPAAAADAGPNLANAANAANNGHLRAPRFNMAEYRPTEGTTVKDYFTRFSWALELSEIPAEQHANYARVYMGRDLNDALKFLISPRLPEALEYAEIQQTLIKHFDHAKNKFAESIKFRKLTQNSGEAVADFALRLKQGAVYCEFDAFLDRMLIEQLLFGLESQVTCDEIIAKKPASFAEAFEIANSLEATRLTSDTVKNKAEPTNKLGFAPPKLKYTKRPKQGRPYAQAQGVHKPTGLSYQPRQSQDKQWACQGCGGQHARSQCPYRDAICNACNKRGHIAPVCRSGNVRQVKDHSDSEEEFPAEQVDQIRRLNKIDAVNAVKFPGKVVLDVLINGRNVKMEIDTGAPCAIVSKQTLDSAQIKYKLLETNQQFASFSGHRISCIGRTSINAQIGSSVRKLDLYVADGLVDSLLGREWIVAFANEINFSTFFRSATSIHAVNSVSPRPSLQQQAQLASILTQFGSSFDDKPGKLIGPPVKLHFKPGYKPVFSRARDIPYALRDAYSREIEDKLNSGVYKRVEYSEWASTTHVVAKKNGKLRITGNYKPTLNPQLIVDEHPIPRVECIFNKMRGAKWFCHLDITDAYTHLTIDEECAHAMTLNTPTHGLIRPTRAVYGAANIPAVWQRRMEEVLRDLPCVVNFFDDTIVFANSFENLLRSLCAVLERMRHHGLKLNRAKCKFAETTLHCLGHKLDAQGIHKSDCHIEAIRDAPKPSTPEELQLFLGKATYYSAFIPDLSTRDRPLRDMLRSEPFIWTPAGEKAYVDIKDTLVSPQVLMQYDPSLPLLLATDASKTGLGAVLSHRLSNGQERPIAYASRTMSATEQRYPQIDKEALAIVWAVHKFFVYLYARHFVLITDHKPLTQILHPEKSLPVLCISRMANYADYLAHFNFEVVFKDSKANANADYCSRAPLPTTVNQVCLKSLAEGEGAGTDEFDQFIIHQIKQLPVRAEAIARATHKDEHLGNIRKLLESGQDLLRHGFKPPEANYTLAANCLLFEHRVVIPPSLRNAILQDLHAAHIGIVKMKGLARSFVFWPGIDAAIEHVAKSCTECAKHAHAPAQFREHHWEYPTAPWQRIHIDYAGPVAGNMLLIIVDAYSKWLEVRVTKSTTSAATSRILDNLFATFGAPVTLVSDNAPQFTSAEFKDFLIMSGVKYHKLTAPYHPSTNGQAERYVQTVKDALRAMSTTESTLQTNINEFLRQYRKAPHATTGASPAQLFIGRDLRTRLNLALPDDLHTKISEKQKASFDASYRTFHQGDLVYFLSENPRMDKWVMGEIVSCLGDLHYEIDFHGKQFKRHIDQIRSHEHPLNQEKTTGAAESDRVVDDKTDCGALRRTRFYGQTQAQAVQPQTPRRAPEPHCVATPARARSPPATPVASPVPAVLVPAIPSTPRIPRRSQRERRAPLRFSPQ